MDNKKIIKVDNRKKSFSKREYFSPTLTEIGKANNITKGKTNPGPDAGTFLES